MLPVVFTGSFQNPSLYHFFTQGESFVLSSVNSRQTQFDIWQGELAWQGRAAFVMGSPGDGRSAEYAMDGQKFYGYVVRNFQSVNRVKICYTLPQTEVRAGDTLNIAYQMHNPASRPIEFRHAELPVSIMAVYGAGRRFWYAPCSADTAIVIGAQSSVSGCLQTIVPDVPSGAYRFAISLDNGICAAANSVFVKLKIREVQ